MGGSRPALVTLVAAAVAAVMVTGSGFVVEGPTAAAAKTKSIVACPKKVGIYKLDDVRASAEHSQQTCHYDHRKKPGWVRLSVDWWPDSQGERSWCETRQPVLADTEGYDGRAWRLMSPARKVHGSISLGHETRVSTAAAEAALRRLITAAEPLAHACVPEVAAMASDGLSCPLRLPGDLVRGDWYHLTEPYTIEPLAEISDGRYGLKCTYRPAYVEDGDSMLVWVQWKEGPPAASTLCLAKIDERIHTTKHRTGHYPLSVEISNEFVERWGGQVLADGLAAAAAARTQRCPDAPAGPAPYEVGSGGDEPDEPTGTTTIVLSGGPDEEPPSVGTTIEVPEDDQHQLVVGGPDGEVIREEFIGDQATIGAYGPLVTDTDGNWSVLVTVEVTTALEPTPVPSPEPSPVPTLAVTPELTSAPRPDTPGADPTTAPATFSPTEEPTAAPTQAPGPTASPTAVPPPELIGVPAGIAAIVAKLPPEGAGAVRNVSDHVAVLGEILEEAESGEVTVPASDIASLQALKPDYVTGVRLGSGSIIVSTSLGDTLVTPVRGENGLIEVKLSRFTFLETHEIVEALTAALNGYVAERGGRFTMISVTPEGITLVAEGPTRE